MSHCRLTADRELESFQREYPAEGKSGPAAETSRPNHLFAQKNKKMNRCRMVSFLERPPRGAFHGEMRSVGTKREQKTSLSDLQAFRCRCMRALRTTCLNLKTNFNELRCQILNNVEIAFN